MWKCEISKRHLFVSNIGSLSNLHDNGNEIVTKKNEFMLLLFSQLVKYGQTSSALNS